MQPVIVLVPIYKPTLDPFEQYSLDRSVAALPNREIVLIGPEGLDVSYYAGRYPGVRFRFYEPRYFASIEGYNHLLLSPDFYAEYADYEFTLILQTDAIVLRDELDFWCSQPFDYVGAPWPMGVELFVNAGVFEGDNGRHTRTLVGNGGLSLRRNRKAIALLKEFEIIVTVFEKTGSSEDLFFSIMGGLSTDYILPNEIIASRFAMELKPSYYLKVNGGKVPMGGHAWWKFEFDFWRQQLPDIQENLLSKLPPPASN